MSTRRHAAPDGLERFLSADQRASIRAPISEARTLPRTAFTAQDFFDLEVERIFRRNWMALCFADALPNRGDVVPLELFGMPLLALRGDDAQVRVFHNVCPYDGCLVSLDPQERARELVVPYHGWRYDLRGKLRAIPYWDGNETPDLRSLGGRDGDLAPVRSATQLGIVFINLDGNAGTIDAYLAPLRNLLSDLRLDELVAVEDDDGKLLREGRTIRANWKTYLENAAINILHEAFTHGLYGRSVEVPRVRDGTKTHFAHLDGVLMGLGYEEKDVLQTYPPIPLPHIGRDPARPPQKGYFLTLYPNLVVPVMNAALRTNICLPQSPGLTRILHCGWFHPDALADPQFETLRTSLRDTFHEAYREDGRVIEAVQRGRRSPVSGQHFYAPFWDEQHHHFNNLILDDLEASRAE